VSDLASLPPLRDVIAAHGLRAKKGLGQNFLLDLNLTARIARAAGDLTGADVLEIGPGPGGLTRALLGAGARRVVAVERDARCLPALAEIAAACPGRLEVIAADALTFDPAPLLTPPVRVVANLPYNIGTALLVRWLTPADWPPFWSSLTLMFQREVADRITARPGSRPWGRLTILAQWRAEARRLFDVPAAAFTPAPKVASAVVQLTALPAPRFPRPPGGAATGGGGSLQPAPQDAARRAARASPRDRGSARPGRNPGLGAGRGGLAGSVVRACPAARPGGAGPGRGAPDRLTGDKP
jgi:16S rRNA (adenine1518-N6/adenine1519-N6)-dimethyltransferase